MRFRLWCAVALLWTSGCSFQKPIVVGSKDGIEQQLLAEITAQHLEHRLNRKVERRMEIGDTHVAYQALLDGQIGLYPEYSGLIVTELLKKDASTDPAVVMEFARIEMKRVSLLDYLEPLGFDGRTALVVRAAGNEKIHTASNAAASATKWKLGMSIDFQQRETTIPQLSHYSFELGAPFRGVRAKELFPLLADNKLNMAVTTLCDGNLTAPEWKVLEDDGKVFPAAQPGLLVREDLLAEDGNIRQALNQLAGKISLDAMRKMNAAVEIDERQVKDVAAEFLKSQGLN